MKAIIVIIAALSMALSFGMVREARAFVGLPPDFAFGRLVITDGGQTVDLHHPTDPNSGVQHLRLGLSSYTIVDAWWERDGNTAKIMIHVADKNGSQERDMLLGSAHIS